MHKVEGIMNGIMINGYIGVGDISRGNRNHQSFFINNRYTKNRVITLAMEHACRERVMTGRFPICVLHLQVPYEQADVNVHPNKTEVRFQNDNNVSSAVETIIADNLVEHSVQSKMPASNIDEYTKNESIQVVKTDKIQIPVINPVSEPERTSLNDTGLRVSSSHTYHSAVYSPYKEEALKPMLHEKDEMNTTYTHQPDHDLLNVSLPDSDNHLLFRIIGHFMNTYLLLQHNERLIMIDQHAAHERILYDKMVSAYNGAEASQLLLLPQPVTLSAREMAVYEENIEVIKAAGFEIDLFGDDTVQIRSVPMILREPQMSDLLPEILYALDTQNSILTEDVKRNLILQQACKHAVKGGESLTEEDIEYLLNELLAKGVTPTCPHGRPLIIFYSKSEIEKRFKRL
jgi:DNA mismatch repair protein MutL